MIEGFFLVFVALDALEAAGEVSKSGDPSTFERSARGESGEKEGNEVRDLSEAAIDEAELVVC